MRVGIIGLQHESNTFLRTPTTLADFEQGARFDRRSDSARIRPGLP